MKTRRRIQQVVGEPSRVASRAAVRLAYLGEQVEPVSDTEFVWRPHAAERRLFRCPGAVKVTVLPASDPGRANVVCEWRGGLGQRWLWLLGGGLAAAGVVGAILAPGSIPGWRMLFGLWPAFMALLAPWLMDSGWASRLAKLTATGASQVFSFVPDADRWLSLDDERRDAVVRELANKAGDLASAPDNAYGGDDRRSSAELLGWPLWHVATGRDPVTDQVREAHGWYARGQVARGMVAVGQFAQGWVAFGQLAFGLVAVGQLAVGLVFAAAQLGLAALVAVAQASIALVGIGMVALGLFQAWMGGADSIAMAVLKFVCLAVPLGTLALMLAVKGWLSGAEQRQLAADIERQAHQPSEIADDLSLSRAERLTGGADPGRGLSSVEVTEQE